MRKNVIINGVDCSLFFPKYGQRVRYPKVYGDAGGTMLDGTETEDVIKVKSRITLDFIPQTEERMHGFIKNLYSAPYAMVEYFDPMTNSYKTIEAIYSEVEVLHLFENAFSDEMWKLHSLTLTER